MQVMHANLKGDPAQSGAFLLYMDPWLDTDAPMLLACNPSEIFKVFRQVQLLPWTDDSLICKQRILYCQTLYLQHTCHCRSADLAA